MPNIGPLEIVIVLVIVLIIFGPKRLPELGRSMGRGMREFKNSITGGDEDEPREIERSRDGVGEDASRPIEGEIVHDRKP
jgi:sec-independent protein translocase protein TatA